ncbi:hypothetical protein D3C78_1355580 [compost metagenome]
MDQIQSKVPPRYVPTLTEVVTGPDAQSFAQAVPAAAAAPSRPVDEVAEPRWMDAPEGVDPPAAWPAPAPPIAVDLAAVEERLVQRLLQRVELALDQKLQACIAQVVQEQTRSITLRLQEELESVVRQTVHDAVAQELAPD